MFNAKVALALTRIMGILDELSLEDKAEVIRDLLAEWNEEDD